MIEKGEILSQSKLPHLPDVVFIRAIINGTRSSAVRTS